MTHCRRALVSALLTASLWAPFIARTAAEALPQISGIPAASRPFPAIFGAGEAPGANLAAFKRWTAALERLIHETPGYDEPCAIQFRGRCVVGEWRQLVRSLEGRARRERIDAVN
ncbi:MAG: hypothetical protein FJX57_23315, partial [Alphaproteobacteria bacterium]|nr:hypothetical protein [Alphaproteobacteria bacterium]